MPAKSRKNRRPQARRVIPGPGGNNIANTDNAINTQPAGQVNQPSVSTSRVSKATEVPVGTYFATEVKWIAIVTAIIVVLLIVSYYMFR